MSNAHAYQRSLRFDRMSIDNGLALQSVLTIIQDRQGYMWFGTQAGLNRFDGYRVRLYRNDPEDPASLPDNYILSSHLDALGNLWFGTRGGLTRYNAESGGFERFALNQDGSGNSRTVNAIASTRDGKLWLATNAGLVQFDPATNQVRTYHHEPGNAASLREGPVTALALDHLGGLWIGLGSGLDRLAAGATTFEHYTIAAPADLERNQVLSLSMGPRQTLWVGTGRGLEAWELGAGAPRRSAFTSADGVDEQPISALYHDSGANLWVGTGHDGLKWRDPVNGRFVSYRHQPKDHHSLSDNRVVGVLVDRSGTLWVATYYGGVNRTDLASGGFSRFGDAEGSGSIKVRSITDDIDGKLWVGTSNGLMNYDPATDLAVDVRLPPTSNEGRVIVALLRTPKRLWIGTAAGLIWREPDGRYGRVALDSVPPGARYIHSLHLGRDGTLWAMTRGGLLAIDQQGRLLRRWHHVPGDPSSLGSDYGNVVFEDSRGNLWVGTEAGLEKLDRSTNTFTRFRHDPADSTSLRHSRIYTLHESRNGELWIGTAGGLHRMEVSKGAVRFQHYPYGGSLEAPPIGFITQDDEGTIWTSTTVGVTRLDPATGKARNYTSRDGLVDGSYFIGSGFRDSQGWMHFGGIGGMSSFHPSQVRDNPFAPTVVITDMRILNRKRGPNRPEPGARETLTHEESVFALEFTALHYADPQGNRYAYQLQGIDPDWIEVDSTRRFVTYTNLDPGDYVFRVRASNKDGLWSDEPATMVIKVLPPYWKTWWFRLAVALGLLALITVGYRIRVRALVQQRAALAHQVTERTAELLLEKETAERGKLEVERQKESVERAHRDIALLSDMGRTVTANLEREAIMNTLYHHVRELMQAQWFAVALARADNSALEVPFVMHEGQRVAPFTLPLHPPEHVLASCVTDGVDVLMTDLGRLVPRECRLTPADGDLVAQGATDAAPRAVLCVPVTLGERRLGALMVQSTIPGAYGQVHLDMLSTLAAYVAVAFDNAEAYLQLKQTQAQLASRERLASLGSLVAGVAHELNTPIGNSLLMASTLQDKAAQASERFQSARLTRSELSTFLQESTEASMLMVRSLHNAADLVNSFRQVSADQASAQRRRFDLAQACHEIVATLMNKVRLAGHSLQLEIAPGIEMDGYPGPLGQVIINFVNNAMVHAFAHPGGEMVLRATQRGDMVELVFEDDGRGIEQQYLGRVFDPFFTTRLGQGGSGLGMNIVYHIVTTLLGGTIKLESQVGEGTRFVVELPLVAPQPVAAQDTVVEQ